MRAVFMAYLSGEPLSKIAAPPHRQAGGVSPRLLALGQSSGETLIGQRQVHRKRGVSSYYKGKGLSDGPPEERQCQHNRQIADEDIKLFKGLAHCHHCGGIMVRRMDSAWSTPVTWKCPQCGYFLPLPDEDFKQRVFLLQKKLADKPLLAEKEEDEIPVTSMEARRLTNEIFRKLDSGDFSEEELVNLAPAMCGGKLSNHQQRPTHYRTVDSGPAPRGAAVCF